MRKVMRVIVVSSVLSQLVIGAGPASAKCRFEPFAGDTFNRANEKVNAEDTGDQCDGPPNVGLNPGRNSEEYFRDADRTWDNYKWIAPNGRMLNAFEKYKQDNGQNITCKDFEARRNGVFIHVICED